MQAGQDASFRGRRCFSKADWDQCSERAKSRTLENSKNDEHSNVHAPYNQSTSNDTCMRCDNKVHSRPILSAGSLPPSVPIQAPKKRVLTAPRIWVVYAAPEQIKVLVEARLTDTGRESGQTCREILLLAQ
jgi:hypothetical protein